VRIAIQVADSATSLIAIDSGMKQIAKPDRTLLGLLGAKKSLCGALET
jgi:hypothetical protein